MVHRLRPVVRVGAGVSVDIFYRFRVFCEYQFLIFPDIVGDHNIRPLGQAHIQQPRAAVLVGLLDAVLLHLIPQLFNGIKGWLTAGIVI